jgi:hypothetical protein
MQRTHEEVFEGSLSRFWIGQEFVLPAPRGAKFHHQKLECMDEHINVDLLDDHEAENSLNAFYRIPGAHMN